METKQKKNMEKLCRYCELAHTLQDEDTMLCDKKGVVDAGYHCRHFRYDPLKRIPGKIRIVPAMEFVPLETTEDEER